ncbi:TPA: hypothetical protein RNX13_002372 [Pasteurella multocida]|nr:hypothetical protein [Pasteurella multocida]HDX1018355.1 hypothetical protein [Pasteurella multocida]
MTERQEKLKALELLQQLQGLSINEIKAVLLWAEAYVSDYQKFEISNEIISHQEELKSSLDSV